MFPGLGCNLRASTRHELMMWLCMIENQCRKKAGVPLRTCR